MAEFRAEVARLQFEFLDSIRWRYELCVSVVAAGSRDIPTAINLYVVVDSIEAEVVLRPISAIHVELGVARSCGGAGAGGQQSQGRPVPALQWHVVALFLVNRLPNRCIFFLQQWSDRRTDGDLLTNRSHNKLNV